MNNLIVKRIIAFYIDAFLAAILAFFICYIYNNGLINFDDFLQVKRLGITQSIIIILYISITEYIFNRTLGKKIMGLQVMFFNSEGKKINSIVIHTLSRLIPFDIVSFSINNGDLWHDLLSKTKVVDK
jgi:uncharacterized RDD family membrane protein YckC